ncbi:hypothetical protein Dimus_007179 [Dionaea muscipula]
MCSDGSQATTSEAIAAEILKYYDDLLGTARHSIIQIDEACLNEGGRLTRLQQNNLVTAFCEADVKEALWGIGDDKAPGGK